VTSVHKLKKNCGLLLIHTGDNIAAVSSSRRY